MREFHPNSVAVRSGVAVLVVASTLLGTSQRVRAEFKVGEELPEFSLRTADDSSTFSLQRKRDRVLVARGDKQLEPRLVVLDLFQPDCLQCQVQLKVLEELHKDFGNQGVLVVGVAHRGDAEAVRASSKQLKVTFPLVVGKGSKLAKQFAAGDSFAIADQQGVIRFAQVGYGEGDEKVWRENIELLLAGQPVKETTIARERLQGGDRLPVIELSSVMSGKPTALTGEGDRLTFRDETGKVSHPKAAVGFFSRY